MDGEEEREDGGIGEEADVLRDVEARVPEEAEHGDAGADEDEEARL